MKPLLVVLVVGLAPRFVGAHTPHIKRLMERSATRPLKTVFPAVTCTAQSSLLTGETPQVHGAVANGWYFRDLSEVMLWRQPNQLVHGEKVWDAARARDANFTCAQMFWWYNMYANVEFSATPRPMYPADGRKIPDHYASPPALRDELNAKLGMFPLFKFWGPLTDISASQWIADATIHVMEKHSPTLTFCYLPHLDYNLQRLGPDLAHPTLQKDLQDVDAVTGQLIEHAEQSGRDIVLVSEYGITAVTDAIHINRALREAGFLKVRSELGRDVFDAGASDAFALSDHQAAHIYVRDPKHIAQVKALLETLDGVEAVLDKEGKHAFSIDHPRSGELVAIANADRWFSYYYWLNDARAPDYARTVDIHRKPGYDPVELFLDPELSLPMLSVATRLAKRKLGFRSLLDVISLNATASVKGSHGRLTDDTQDGPLVVSTRPELLEQEVVAATDFKQLILRHLFD
jgi:predicted AlkP superfamily pyrophosphatase or phosphodiesterase